MKTTTYTPEVWLVEIRKAMQANAHLARSQAMANYMKNQFSFYGISSPERKKLLRELILELGKPAPETIRELAILLWKEEEREMQYAAMDLLEGIRKKLVESDILLFQELITQKSWWDSVDLIASHLVGPWFLKFPEQRDAILKQWFKSQNLWLKRTILIHQLLYKKNTDEKILFQYIAKMTEEKDFFIRKAIGWALRQYSRTNQQAVANFVDNTPMSPLSYREATKHL